MDILSSALGLKAVKLPQLSEPQERVIADPGSAVQRMVSEIHGPSTRFEASALQRIAASGQIEVQAAGATLSTDTIFSTDGGQSWSTGGTARLSLQDKTQGQQASFSADLLSFSAQTQELIARGHVRGSFQQRGQTPLQLAAAELHGELKTGAIRLDGGLQVTSGTLQLATAQGKSAPPVRFNLKTKQLSIDGPFTLSDSGRDLNLDGGGAEAALGSSQQVTARGPVHVRSTRDDLDLTADHLTAQLEPLRLTASGNVHFRYKGSSYEAQQAVLTRSGQKLVLELSGPQTGRINLDELRRK
jgi:lipopolysaccharide assembly outer membrane protein LptD (OstA)